MFIEVHIEGVPRTLNAFQITSVWPVNIQDKKVTGVTTGAGGLTYYIDEEYQDVVAALKGAVK